MLLLFLAFFPSMQSDEMKQLAWAKIESISTAVLAVLGLESIPDFSKIHPYFGYVMQYINLAIAIFATSRGANMLIREETEGTIEYLYAKPVSRTQILAQKAAANILGLILMLCILFMVTAAGFMAFANLSLEEAFREGLRFYPRTFFVCLIFMALGIFISTILSSSRQVTSIAPGIVFATFIFGAISVLSKQFDFLEYLSPLDWIKSITDEQNGPNSLQYAIGTGSIFISLAAAISVYRKKDLNI